MKKRAAIVTVFSAAVFAQNGRDAIDTHLIAARTAAGSDFTGTLARLCIAPAFVPNTVRDVAPGAPPARESWFIEPAKVFDNLYFVGSKIHNSWALTTSQGIILLDTLYTYNSEEEIVGGLRKLGLDPASVKYVIVTHAHGDHVGGAKLMQDRFASRIVMGGPDWESIERSANGYPLGKPKRDIVADDGQKITLGDTSVTIVTTPGHTPGTLSMIFTVKDNGKLLTVAYSGGTAFNFPSTPANFDVYISSQRKMAAAAAAANATVFLSNHSEFDSAVPKIRMLAGRKPGEAHPFELGKAAVARYFTMTAECAEAAKLKLTQRAP
ncbi:MAG TPA: MBL fold metallo-hydrolase [Bryobacteraceae bacterium]|jgi:metallo-beta-lactamase class B|nr:MBL fold metallo-hydrolase [Bryobacteraceae bacterium]